MGSLREVQKLDELIREIEGAKVTFDDRLAEVEEPALALEAELGQVQQRLSQMETDARRLERGADDKRTRAEKMEQRLNQVSNLREEAAVKTELDLMRRAIEADEQEALQLIDLIRRAEIAEQELAARTREARESVEPRQAAFLQQREELETRLIDLRERREEVLSLVAPTERRVYEAFHQSGREVVVAPLLEDGACGHCFGMIPLQRQNEVRQGNGLVRCEACGVILTTEPEPVLDATLLQPVLNASDFVARTAEEDIGVGEGGEGDDEVDTG